MGVAGFLGGGAAFAGAGAAGAGSLGMVGSTAGFLAGVGASVGLSVVVDPPLQIVVAEAVAEVGSADFWFTVTVAALELSVAHTPLCTTARYCVVALSAGVV